MMIVYFQEAVRERLSNFMDQPQNVPLDTRKYYRLEAICTRTKNYFSMNDKIDFFAFRDFWGNFGIFEFLNITRVSRQSEALA